MLATTTIVVLDGSVVDGSVVDGTVVDGTQVAGITQPNVVTGPTSTRTIGLALMLVALGAIVVALVPEEKIAAIRR